MHWSRGHLCAAGAIVACAACSQGSTGGAPADADAGGGDGPTVEAGGGDDDGDFAVQDQGDIPLPGSPRGMDVDQQTATAFVAWSPADGGAGGGLSVIDMKSGQLGPGVALATDAGPVQPLDVGVDSTTGRVYVTTPSSLLVVDEKTSSVVGTIATTAQPVALAVDSSNGRVYCYEQATDGVVDVIDGPSATLVTSVKTPGFGFASGAFTSGFVVVSSFRHHVWAVGTASDASQHTGVTEIDGVTGSVLGTATFAGTPVGAGIDLQNDDVFVSTTSSGAAPAVNEMHRTQSVVVVGCQPGYLQAQVLTGGYTFLFSTPGVAGCPGATAGGVVFEACGYDGPQAPLCSDLMPMPFVAAPDGVTRIASYFLPDSVVSLLVERGHVSGGALATAPSLRWLRVQTPDQ